MFHIRALKRFQFTWLGQQIQLRKLCLSPTIHYQHLSISVATTRRLTYKNIRNHKNLSKCRSERDDVTNNVSDFLYSHWISWNDIYHRLIFDDYV